MSDYLAVAGVTAVLKCLLNDAIGSGGPASILTQPNPITAKPPDQISTGPNEPAQVNLFMYYSSLNAAFRNVDLPAFDGDGQRLSNPPLALNLHYLISAYGGNDFDGEILLGWAMQVFNDNPILSQATTQKCLQEIGGAPSPSAEVQLLVRTTLVSQVQAIKISPEALSNDEISKLWMAFQSHYRPTTSYQASVVLIRGASAVRSNLPVQSRNVLAVPFQPPVIDGVLPGSIASGGKLKINGRGFLGDSASDTLVQFDEGAPVPADSVQNNTVRVTVPASLRAGVRGVRIIRNARFGVATDPHAGFSSNQSQFLLAPTITTGPPIQVAVGSSLTLNVSPPVAPTQHVSLFIGDHAVDLPPSPAGSPASTSTLVFPIPATFPHTSPPVAVPLRVEVDGAQSPLALDTAPPSPTFGQFLPQAEVTGP